MVRSSGKPAADDGKHLQAVNARHFQIADQQPHGLGFEQCQRAFGGVGGEDFRAARQGGEQVAAQREPVRIIIENQNFMAFVHSDCC